MKRVATEEEFDALRAAGNGFIYNDFASGPNPQYNVLHSASCRWLDRMNLGVPKVHFAPDEDPVVWLNRMKGPEDVAWKRCATCGGASRRAGRGPSPRPSGVTPSRATGRASPPALPQTAAANYLVLPPDGADPAVRAWSATRLQLQGGSWQVHFRRQLVAALSELPTADPPILHATFAATGGEGFDCARRAAAGRDRG
jgi:hypothetical protein